MKINDYRPSDTERKELNELRKKRKEKQLRKYGNLILSEKEYREIQAMYCPGCGRNLPRIRLWFNEMFCQDCFERFSHGK